MYTIQFNFLQGCAFFELIVSVSPFLFFSLFIFVVPCVGVSISVYAFVRVY